MAPHKPTCPTCRKDIFEQQPHPPLVGRIVSYGSTTIVIRGNDGREYNLGEKISLFFLKFSLTFLITSLIMLIIIISSELNNIKTTDIEMAIGNITWPSIFFPKALW